MGKATGSNWQKRVGSSDKDWETLGISFFVPQPSWCFLKLVKGAHTVWIQGVVQKEEAHSVSGMPSYSPQSIQGSWEKLFPMNIFPSLPLLQDLERPTSFLHLPWD